MGMAHLLLACVCLIWRDVCACAGRVEHGSRLIHRLPCICRLGGGLCRIRARSRCRVGVYYWSRWLIEPREQLWWDVLCRIWLWLWLWQCRLRLGSLHAHGLGSLCRQHWRIPWKEASKIRLVL